MLLRSASADHRHRPGTIVLIVVLGRVDRHTVARLEIADLRLAAGLTDVFRRTRRLDGRNHVIVGLNDSIAAANAAEHSDKRSLIVLTVPVVGIVGVVRIIGVIGVLSASLAREPDTRSDHDLGKARDAGQKENGQC
jgi:hypothetical protein